jgi:tRNA splicing ligase
MAGIAIPNFAVDQANVRHVIEKLYQIKIDTPKELRSKDFTLEDGQIWTSWTMRESVYKKKQDTFPTMSRGLFTKKLDDRNYQIMVRGYDKFFNVLETKATQWPSIIAETQGPYEVMAKENGCIIFIAALSEDKVIVTSKHSIPIEKTDTKAHAGVGYNWVLKHLESVQLTEKDLATWLFDKNITLVAELCDDEFEQHILPYTDKDRGLYLHGINYNTPELYTLPASIVEQTAKEFGFHLTDFTVFDTVNQVKEFGNEMQQTGIYNNREVEGAVVRCKRNGMDFMFKIKNEQYLMYREYREITNAILECKDDTVSIIEPKRELKWKYEKTPFYIEWLRKRVLDKPEWFREYKSNKGIIHVRQEFERYWEIGCLL